MLDELRKKPRGLKEAYAFWGAFTFTGMITAVWLASIPLRFSDTEVEGTTQTAGALSQFFEQMKTNISGTWQENKRAFEGSGGEEGAADTIASSSSGTAISTSSDAGAGTEAAAPVLIATSSPRYVEIATSSVPRE